MLLFCSRAVMVAGLSLCVVLLWCPPGSAQAKEGEDAPPVIRKIIIEREQIYTQKEAESTRLFRIINAVNWVTRERIVRQELLFQEGDLLDVELVAETERNLRAIKGLATVLVLVEPVREGQVDIRVRTRDALTLRFEASTSFVGGEAQGRLSLGENNLFGYGSSLSYIQTRRSNKRVDRVQYFEPRVFGSRHSFFSSYAGGHTEANGGKLSTSYYLFEIARPLYRLDTRHAYAVGYVFDDGMDTFFNGDIDATTDVEREKTGANLSYVNRWGSRFDKHTLTSQLAFEDTRYGAVFGTRPIAVPDNAAVWTWIENYSERKTDYFLEQEQLDALEGIEDVEFGWEAGLSLGAGYRDNQTTPDRLSFIHGLNLQSVSLPVTEGILALKGTALGRVDAGRYQGWEVNTFAHYYYQGLPEQTLVSSIAFDAVYEGEGLERELVLDEASGLRGYRAKAFSGNKRLRLNVEDRIFTPIEFYSVVVGVALFFDSGYVWKRGEHPDLGDLRSSAGIGLRIGSLPLIKKNVIRIDMAFPFTSDDAAGFSISFSGGQVIQLLRNAEGNENF
ncbi:MAG: BamA/TamA family outer membrane protein [Nitrospiria bacterium]